MHDLLSLVHDLLVLVVFVIGAAIYGWWVFNGPRAGTRARIAVMLKAKSLDLVSVKPERGIRQGWRHVLVARARNALENTQTEYFDVNPWADIFTNNPTIRELGTQLDTTRGFFG